MLTKAHITRTEPLECRSIRPNHIGAQCVRNCHQPSVILTHSFLGTPLQKRASSRLGKVQSLNRESLKRGERGSFIRRAFQNLFNAHD